MTDNRTTEKELITIALQLVRYHYDKDDAKFDESCIELERWCYELGKVDLAEFAAACRCPALSFVPMQAIAATVGNGTCELAYGEDDEGYDGWYCQSCGGWFDAVRRGGKLVEPMRCGCCGKAVER